MRIKAIELKNYLRMSLNEYSFIRIDFDSQTQLILGTNGSGKSSLLESLNPLAAHHSDFSKGGYKHIWIEHRGSEYECISDFSSGRKHTFIKDGVILNDGGNATMQNRLVEEHFNYTTEIRDLQLGKILFTKLNATQRRYWFNKISTVDYTFANKAFQYFRERNRDLRGSIRENKSLLVAEQSKLPSKEEINSFEKQVNLLHQKTTELLEHRENPKVSIDDIMLEYGKYDSRLREIARSILESNSVNTYNVNNENHLIELIDETKLSIASIESTLRHLNETYNSVKRRFDDLKKSSDVDIGKLNKRKGKLKEELKDIKSKLRLNLCLDIDPSSLHDISDSALISLEPILNVLPPNPDRKLSSDALNRSRELLGNLKSNVKQMDEVITKLNNNISHLEHHRDKGNVKCPSCKHEWILNYDSNRHSNLLQKREKVSKDIEKAEEKIKKLEEKIQELNEYGLLVRQFNSVVSSSYQISEFFNKVKKENTLYENPQKILYELNLLKDDAVKLIKSKTIEDEIKRIEDLITMSKDVGVEQITHTSKQLADVSSKISKFTIELTQNKSKLSQLEIFLSEARRIKALTDEMQSISNSLQELDKKALSAFKFEIIDEKLKETQSLLSSYEKRLNEINSTRGKIKYLEDTIKSQEMDYEATQALLKVINPTDGLIAEAMFGFINLLVNKINKEIQKVWSYPLQLGVCKVEDEENLELDYRFPLYVGSSLDERRDVSEGSDAMQEIINLVFVLIACEFLNMGDYPIYLDEFASSFDETHREKAIFLIKSLLDNYNFSQIFMVSHYLSVHGAISNAQICVLNDNNLKDMQGVNEHVTFK